MWIPPEVMDPVLWHHPTRKSVGYFGAVRLRDGKLVHQREEQKFNKETYFPISPVSETLCQPLGTACRRDCRQRFLSPCSSP
jgi:hypothetical protein